MPFRFQTLEIPNLLLIEPVPFEDHRGLFIEIYRRSEFVTRGIPNFVQDNFSSSTRHVLRGLHYQRLPKAQAKLVMVLRGEIFDVAVDIRFGSPTYARWVGHVLSENNRWMLYIPQGFAHGFCVLSEHAAVLYKTTSEYDPTLDCGILWSDPQIGIRWPVDHPTLSERDARLPTLATAERDFVYEQR